MQAVRNKALLMMTALLYSAVFASEAGKIVLVLDDIGNQQALGTESIQIPWVTTVAVMPARPFSTTLAEYAHQMNKEVIVHMPMANEAGFPLGALGLTEDLNREQFLATVKLAIMSVPHAVGLSNHMGSALTQDAQSMSWLMSALKRQHFYFLDSRTIATTIAWQVAQVNKVPWAMRNVFLDHSTELSFLSKQWQKALDIAYAGKIAIVICHPYPETIAFLNGLQLSSIEQAFLVPLSVVLHHPEVNMPKIRNRPEGI